MEGNGRRMVLSIVEVSQKQAYIFSSNKLKENVERSAEIAWVTSSAFFEKSCKEFYSEEENLVYAGGGHTVLCFTDDCAAKRFNEKLTFTILRDFPDMEMFAKIVTYNEEHTPSENLKELTKELEKKKSIRRASFHQGTFGLERIERLNYKPVKRYVDSPWRKDIENGEKMVDQNLLPVDYKNISKLDEFSIGGGKSNYIAVVHIDGNGMGARINNLYKKLEDQKLNWDCFRKKIQKYSQKIDSDYKDAYKEMLEEIAKLEAVEKKKILPVRRIITSGDDICFVADGTIGIECARIFIEKLTVKTNTIDEKKYTACAGVSITHVKYPFFRSYELAETLCSNAKRHGAMMSPDDNGASISLIDWQLSLGELKNSLEEERELYRTQDGKKLFGRPYVVGEIKPDSGHRSYSEFKAVVSSVNNENETAVRSKIKNLRNMLKHSSEELKYYSDFYHLGKILENDRGVLFDAIEIMDVYRSL